MARFLKPGGQPPPGVRRLGRWTALDRCGEVVLLQSEGPQAVTAFAYAWNDVVELTTAPVLEDEDLAGVLQRASTQPAQMGGCPVEYPCTAPGVSGLVTARRPREETRGSSPRCTPRVISRWSSGGRPGTRDPSTSAVSTSPRRGSHEEGEAR
jgi:hypothetical protein